MRKISWLFYMFLLAYMLSGCGNKKIENQSLGLAPYPEEAQAVLGRGLVALPLDQNRIFVSWRLLPDDPDGVSFEVYRRELGKTDTTLEFITRTEQASYIDSRVREEAGYGYSVRPVSDGKTGEFAREATVTASRQGRPALIFDIGQEYKHARVATGDLNGDGELEIVIAYANSIHVDPWEKAWVKSEDTYKVAAFLHTGERLWTIDLGWGIEAGTNFAPMVIWDLDADGRAEVILKTNKSGDRLDYEGERLTILNGTTGKVKTEAKWPSVNELGESFTSNSRNYISIAHLDGKNPYIIVARGLYKRQRIWAYDNRLNRAWERMVGNDLYEPKTLWERVKRFWDRPDKAKKLLSYVTNNSFRPDEDRGSHSLPIADINDDGKEEILWGEHIIGEGGKDLWAIEERMPYNGHPDIVFAADVVPSIKGKEIYYCREGWDGKDERIGMMLVDNKGKTIWAHWGYRHIDGGWVAKIIPDQEGMQLYGFDIQPKTASEGILKRTVSASFVWGSDGKLIANPPNPWDLSFPVDWDGDGVREISLRDRDGSIQKYNGPVVARLGDGVLWGADLFGDHREEIVSAPGDGKVYVLFNTDIRESPPRITPLADRQYRNDLSRTAMQFNVIPTEGGFMPKKHQKTVKSGDGAGS